MTGIGDIFWQSPAAQRRFAQNPFLPGRGGGVSPSGFDPTGGDVVDSDFGGKAHGETFGEGHDGPFCGAEKLSGIAIHPRLSLIPAHGDNRAVALGGHLLTHSAAGGDGGLNIH